MLKPSLFPIEFQQDKKLLPRVSWWGFESWCPGGWFVPTALTAEDSKRLTNTKRAMKSESYFSPLVLLVQPLFQRSEVIEDSGRVHPVFAGERLEGFRPRPA